MIEKQNFQKLMYFFHTVPFTLLITYVPAFRMRLPPHFEHTRDVSLNLRPNVDYIGPPLRGFLRYLIS